jgi:PAS domain S-box-containing protein
MSTLRDNEREPPSIPGKRDAAIDAGEAAALLADNATLRARLHEAEETIAAIRCGDVDGLVVGENIYILDSAHAATNKLRNDVLAQMEDAVLAFDAQDHIIFMNAAAERQYGRYASDVLGRPRSSLFLEQWPEGSSEAAADEALQTLGVYRVHSIHIRTDGTSMHVESTVSRLRETAALQVGRLAVIRDITHRIEVEKTLREATDALRDADRRKDEFLATLAHELRNPLAPIRNALHIMQRTNDPATQEAARKIIQRQLGQMVHLVDDLLDVSRISQGKVELRLAVVDAAHAVQTALETSRPAIEGARHQLSVDLPPPHELMVRADLTRLCQIVANLLNNAAKYTPPGGRIDVSAKREGDDAVISVQDSGVGISSLQLARIFEMFAQGDRSEDAAQGGLGIGLALVRRLVEMHGGFVTAESEGPGTGSRFVVRIPALPVNERMPVQDEDAAASPVTDGSLRVLVVDDNIDSADSLAQLLQINGHLTHVEHDGLGAVSAASTYAPQAIFLDIGLPKLNGLEAAKRIRATACGRKVLLVALSGWGQDEDRRKSKEAGFDHHFVKPVDIDALTQLLNTLRH